MTTGNEIDSREYSQVTEEDDFPRKGSAGYIFSKAVSAIFNPLLIPIYTLPVFLFNDSIFALSPLRTKFIFGSMVALGAYIVPAMFIALLRTFGIISRSDISLRQNRTILIALTALFYGISIFMLSNLFFGFMIRKFLIAAFCCAMAALIINAFGKISLHMIAIGGATAIFALLAVAGMASIYLHLMVCILLSGIIGSARLYLGKSSPLQVFSGFAVGFVVSAMAMLIKF